MNRFFLLLSSLVEIYSVLCIVRLFLTWIPGAAYSKAADVLSKICDPFLNVFRGIKFLRIGAIDFSPALALCALAVLSSILKSISYGAQFSPILILIVFLSAIESFIISILTFIIIIHIIRLVIIFVQGMPMNRSPILESLDSVLMPFCYKIAKTFTLGRSVTYKTALIISIITLILFSIVTAVLFNMLGSALTKTVIALNGL